jgi:hypothetical protein
MFHPYKVNGDWRERIVSLFTAGQPLLSGTLVDINLSDTVAVGTNASVGFTTMRAGSVIAASITSSSLFPRELGIAIPSVTEDGPSFEERVLQLAASYMTIPVGYAIAVFKPSPGDIIASDQYVGALSSDNGAAGILDITNAANYGAACGVFNGRFRLKTGSDTLRARYIGNTTAPTGFGSAQGQVALFEFN